MHSNEWLAIDVGTAPTVQTADDAEALWAWVNTPGGRDDLGAWKRVLRREIA
jgi:hypothetical protein